MAQMTIRTDDDLLRRTQQAAERAGQSMNEFVTAVLEAMTNPEMAGTEAERVRERLARAGLLEVPRRETGRRPSEAAVAAAGRRAAKGRAVADYVRDSR